MRVDLQVHGLRRVQIEAALGRRCRFPGRRQPCGTWVVVRLPARWSRAKVRGWAQEVCNRQPAISLLNIVSLSCCGCREEPCQHVPRAGDDGEVSPSPLGALAQVAP
jgi:hypothetical protein